MIKISIIKFSLILIFQPYHCKIPIHCISEFKNLKTKTLNVKSKCKNHFIKKKKSKCKNQIQATQRAPSFYKKEKKKRDNFQKENEKKREGKK